MTSDDTHLLTLKLLEDNHYFGMKKEQVYLMKQEKVPALTNNDAHFAMTHGKLEIECKPHGHGDVHTLLFMHKLAEKWESDGFKWVVFLQDTNASFFRTLPAVLGVSSQNQFEVNSIAIPRKPGEALGAIMQLTREDGSASLTINVEYNQLDAMLKPFGTSRS
jgi:UDP-sugar pyrophosphorylase